MKKTKRSHSAKKKQVKRKVVTVKVVKETKKAEIKVPSDIQTKSNILTEKDKSKLIWEAGLDLKLDAILGKLEKKSELQDLNLELYQNKKKFKDKKALKVADYKESSKQEKMAKPIKKLSKLKSENLKTEVEIEREEKQLTGSVADESSETPRKIDRSTHKKSKTTLKLFKRKLKDLDSQGPLLVRGLKKQDEFKGGILQKIDADIYGLQQEAIKIELKINSLFLKKKDVKINYLDVYSPARLTQEIREEVIFERFLFEKKEISTERMKALLDLGWCCWSRKKNASKPFHSTGTKKFKQKRRKELFVAPEAFYFDDHNSRVKSSGFYIPVKFLSWADHFLDIVVNRFVTLKNIQFKELFERNNYQSFRNSETKHQKKIIKNLGQHRLIGDYADIPFFQKKVSIKQLSLRVIPKPLVHLALKNKKMMEKLFEKIPFMKFPWSHFDLKPLKHQALTIKPLSPIFIDPEVSLLHEKPQIPPYWKTIREKSQYFSSSLYREFIENFGEYDLLNYGKDSWETVKSLRDRYFENHLSNEELSVQANQEIAPELNRMMKLLNEQPFLVFPLGASPAMYSILPELDGITEELSRHKITPEKKKKVSVKDVHIRSLKGIPLNILSNTENSLSFSSDDCVNIEVKEFSKLKKFRDFEVEEYSKTCYSRFSQSMLQNCSRLRKSKEIHSFKKKLPFWAFLNDMFLLDNDALNTEGYLPYFEKKVLQEDYKKGTFNHSLMYWEREFKKTKHLDSSIRHNKYKNALALKLSLLDLKLS